MFLQEIRLAKNSCCGDGSSHLILSLLESHLADVLYANLYPSVTSRLLLLVGTSISLEYETRKGKGKDSARDTRNALLAAECEPFNIQYAHEPRAVQYAICKLAPQQVNSAITRQYNSTIQSHACRATRTTTTLVDIILDPLSIHLSIDFQFASRSYIRFRFRLEFDLFLCIDL
jgi:hypothetical protein